MPGPIDYLKMLGFNLPPSEDSAPLAVGEDMPGSYHHPLDNIIEGGLGMLGVGADSKANRGGQLISAAIPFLGATSRVLQGLRGASSALGAGEAGNAARLAPRGATFGQTAAALGEEGSGTGPIIKGSLGSFNPDFTPVGAEDTFNTGRSSATIATNGPPQRTPPPSPKGGDVGGGYDPRQRPDYSMLYERAKAKRGF